MSDLFTPIVIRGETVRNRVFVSPMCQYSSNDRDGMPNSWHMVHLGTRAVGGAGLVMAEATAVSPEGRISPEDLGIWSDGHAEAFKPICSFISSQGGTPAVQLAHAGRKASRGKPWEGSPMLMLENGGWGVVAPSSLAFDQTSVVPAELTTEDINNVVNDFRIAAERAVTAGFKVIELHFAHGYLVCEFMSPTSNRRNDLYGGTLKNRCRLAVQIVEEVRSIIPDSMPLFARISCDEYIDEGWNLGNSVELSGWLKECGVDLIDCSSGGNSVEQKLSPFPGYQVPFSREIRQQVGIKTGAVGLITEPSQAEQTLRNGESDVIFLGRELLRNPYWPAKAREFLDKKRDLWPPQYERA